MKTNTELAELLDTVDMEDFLAFESIDYRVTRGRSGTQLNLKECPRCHGRDWKVYLNAETGLGNCFHGSCAGEPGFSKFTYIHNLCDKNYKETMTVLKRYATSVGWRAKTKSKPVQDVTNDVVLPPNVSLPVKGKTLKYLSDRGFGVDTAEYFDLRFCKQGSKYGYTLGGEQQWQDYSNRVLIPIRNIEGDIVTFQGRSIEPDPYKKYLFPPGLAGSGRYIFNAHNSLGCKEAVIGEGVFDVAAIRLAFEEDPTFKGIATIGSFGKSLSMAESGDATDQLSDLKKLKAAGLEEITIMWDGEPAAIKAAVNVALELKRYGFKTRVAVLPEGKDPNEVPAQVVREVFLQAVEITTFSAIRLLSKLTS